MTTLKRSIEAYIHAKDGNRPHLMADAFTADAEITMAVHTDEISFPARIKGLDVMTAILVRQFSQRYENVYTFCVGAPPDDNGMFECGWLVCMSEKESGATRIGFGAYAWECAEGSGRVERLRITIERMAKLPPESGKPILQWVQDLPYPWCPSAQMKKGAPDIAAAREILQALGS
jgi:hypothetical protein